MLFNQKQEDGRGPTKLGELPQETTSLIEANLGENKICPQHQNDTENCFTDISLSSPSEKVVQPYVN